MLIPANLGDVGRMRAEALRGDARAGSAPVTRRRPRRRGAVRRALGGASGERRVPHDAGGGVTTIGVALTLVVVGLLWVAAVAFGRDSRDGNDWVRSMNVRDRFPRPRG